VDVAGFVCFDVMAVSGAPVKTGEML
jgi:hypothetical protein